ncbi:MAG: DUF6868 family protein [Marinibacterium sp.]
MTVEMLSEFFGWMIVLHVGFYSFTATMVLLFRDRMVNLHARLFDIDPRRARTTVYQWLGAYKLFILIFCVVPYLALRIVV